MDKFPTYELEEEAIAEGYKYIVGTDEAGRGCEHPSAEILTRSGWKFYYELTLDDEILSYAFDGSIVWQPIDEIIEKEFRGNLLELKNRGVHILVTSDHQFDVLRRTFKRDKADIIRSTIVGL